MSSALKRLKKQLNSVELKIKHHLNAIEAGTVNLELVGDRIRELREERELVNNRSELIKHYGMSRSRYMY